MLTGTPVTKPHLALGSTSGKGHTSDPTVRSLLAAKSACAYACGVYASVSLFVAVSLIMLPPPATQSKAFILPKHIILPKQQRSKCQFGACLRVVCSPCRIFPESTKGAKWSLPFSVGLRGLLSHVQKSLQSLLCEPFPGSAAERVRSNLSFKIIQLWNEQRSQQFTIMCCWLFFKEILIFQIHVLKYL